MATVAQSWTFIALLAYFVNALAFVIDKYLLALPIPKPFAYAFWVGVLSSPVFLLTPFLPPLPSDFLLLYFSLAFLSGAAFFSGIVFLYAAIRKSDVSVAATEVGVATAIFTYFLSLLILGEATALGNVLALATLTTGMMFLGKVGRGTFVHALLAGFLLALSFVLLKWTFDVSGFLNGFVWTRAGFVGAALLSLLSPRAKKEVAASFRTTAPSSKLIFVGNKLLAGIGFLILYWAILLGNVSLINALLGVQFLFIFLLALTLQKKIPGIRENLEPEVLRNKIAGMALVVVGFLAILIV